MRSINIFFIILFPLFKRSVCGGYLNKSIYLRNSAYNHQTFGNLFGSHFDRPREHILPLISSAKYVIFRSVPQDFPYISVKFSERNTLPKVMFKVLF